MQKKILILTFLCVETKNNTVIFSGEFCYLMRRFRLLMMFKAKFLNSFLILFSPGVYEYKLFLFSIITHNRMQVSVS